MMNISEIVTDPHANGTFVAAWMSKQSAQQLADWCDQQQIAHDDFGEFHCTLCYSRQPMPQAEALQGPVHLTAQVLEWKNLGETAAVIAVESAKIVQLHQLLRQHGASHDYDEYTPHVTVNSQQHLAPLPHQLPPFELTFDRIVVKPIVDY